MKKAQEEKQDLETPLPNWTKDDLKEVVLHNSYMSPPCVKVRCILQHNGIKFQVIDGKKKDSEYKKIPVLLLNGVQINDSFIMVKNLAPILYGKALTEEEIKFEEEMSYGLMIAMESQMMEDGGQFSNFLGKIKPAVKCCVMVCCCNLVCCRGNMSKKMLAKNGLQDNSIDKYIATIEERLNKTAFLQGDEVGILDLSLYGVTYPFAKKPTMACF